jgi:RNA polymerase sigma-70 factor (ECF subfamily)
MEPPAATAWVTKEMESVRAAAEFDVVVREYWPRVFRFILVSLRDRNDAESLTQDCFLKAFQAWRNFRGDSSVSTWLMRIAVNQLRDHTRNRRLQFWRRTRTASPEEAWPVADMRSSPENDAAAKQQVEAVWRAAAALPQQQRTVFLLRFVEDLDLLEIAAATGLKEGTVKTHLFRALQAVRAQTGEVK